MADSLAWEGEQQAQVSHTMLTGQMGCDVLSSILSTCATIDQIKKLKRSMTFVTLKGYNIQASHSWGPNLLILPCHCGLSSALRTLQPADR